jgi:CRISPR-associated protein (TIGR02584 family)
MNQTVLLAVTGMSPAILTETVWALAMREKTIPSRVIAVTTAAGRERLRDLWMPDPALGGSAPWEALRSALETAGHRLEGRLRFGDTADDIRVITSSNRSTGRSVELEDIRTAADNTTAADFILEQVRGIVANPDTRLVASIEPPPSHADR